MALGFPGDASLTATRATVQRVQPFGFDINDRIASFKTYRLAARIRHGDSGGPLVSPSGDVFGVVVAGKRAHHRLRDRLD